MDIGAVFFDIDGTLVDSNEQHVKAWALAFREIGHPLEPEAIREQIGKGGDLLVPALLPGLDEDIAKSAATIQGGVFKATYLDTIRAFPHATDLVARVHGTGRKVVLASSAKREQLEHYVGLLGIGHLMSASTSIDDVAASKPEPDIFGAALDKIDMAPKCAVVIGDTPYDIEAARKAGIPAIGVRSGPFSARRLNDAGAIAVYADVGELLDRFDHSPLAR